MSRGGWEGLFCSSQVRVLSALPLVRLLLVGLMHQGHRIDDASDMLALTCLHNEPLAPLPLPQEDLTERVLEDKKKSLLKAHDVYVGKILSFSLLLRQSLAGWQELLGQGLKGGCYR